MSRMLIRNRYRALLFAMVQVAILSGIVTATTFRWLDRQASRAVPPLRERSIKLAPLFDYPWMASDEQVEATLRKLYPRLRGPQPKMNHIDHAYRIWGPDAVFDDPEALSGAEMRELLFNHQKFAQVWPKSPGFSYKTEEGCWGIRSREGIDTSAHTDHTLASVSEIGITRDYPVITSEGQTTFAELVETSLSDFSVGQMEYEWSILAYALVLPPTTTWITSEGQQIDFDILAERLMREMLPNGVCFGLHRIAALIAIVRVDSDVVKILSPAKREKVLRYLTVVSQQLVKTQHPYGYWDSGWIGTKPQVEENEEDDIAGDELRDRIIATGHILEGMALAPKEVHPPREVLIRAAQWIIRALDQVEQSKIKEQYAFATHAANALALWRGTSPTEFMKSRLDPSKLAAPGGTRQPTGGKTN